MQYKLYNGKILIDFDKEKHKFTDAKGNNILSVTKITGIIDKSPALMGWAVKSMGAYLLQEKNNKITEELIGRAKREYRNISREAKDKGAAIHDWIHQWIIGETSDMPDDEQIVNGITAFLKFQKKHKVAWLETERVVYSKKYNYGGFLDSIGIMDGKLILPDFKSSNAFYPEMELQVAGYDIAYTEETKKPIQKHLIIRFGKDNGEFDIKEINNIEKSRKGFLGLIPAVKRLEELKKEY